MTFLCSARGNGEEGSGSVSISLLIEPLAFCYKELLKREGVGGDTCVNLSSKTCTGMLDEPAFIISLTSGETTPALVI